MPNTITATVTDVLTKGYAEVAPWEDGKPGPRRCIAEDAHDARRGDVVELKPAKASDDPYAKAIYAMPVLSAVAAALLVRGQSWPERILTGALVGVMVFVLAWIKNRKVRLRRKLAYEVVRIVQSVKD